MAGMRAEGHVVDQAVFDAVVDTATPGVDRFLVGVSRWADCSRLWLVTAGWYRGSGRQPGRRAAGLGVLAPQRCLSHAEVAKLAEECPPPYDVLVISWPT